MGGLFFSRTVVMPGRMVAPFGCVQATGIRLQASGAGSQACPRRTSLWCRRDLGRPPCRTRRLLPDACGLMPDASMVEDHLDVSFAPGRAGGGDGFFVGFEREAGADECLQVYGGGEAEGEFEAAGLLSFVLLAPGIPTSVASPPGFVRRTASSIVRGEPTHS